MKKAIYAILAVALPAIGAYMQHPNADGIRGAGLWLGLCGLVCASQWLNDARKEK